MCPWSVQCWHQPRSTCLCVLIWNKHVKYDFKSAGVKKWTSACTGPPQVHTGDVLGVPWHWNPQVSGSMAAQRCLDDCTWSQRSAMKNYFPVKTHRRNVDKCAGNFPYRAQLWEHRPKVACSLQKLGGHFWHQKSWSYQDDQMPTDIQCWLSKSILQIVVDVSGFAGNCGNERTEVDILPVLSSCPITFRWGIETQSSLYKSTLKSLKKR